MLEFKKVSIFSVSALLLAFTAMPDQSFAQTVNVWLTTDNQRTKLKQQSPISFSAGSGSAPTVFVDETESYQSIEGFGASFTDSAAFLLNEKVPPSQLNSVMTSLFDHTNGIGVSFVRNPMGASDLARFIYSYDDLPAGQTDPNLTNFSISHDLVDIVPLVKLAKQINPQLKFIANPPRTPGVFHDLQFWIDLLCLLSPPNDVHLNMWDGKIRQIRIGLTSRQIVVGINKPSQVRRSHWVANEAHSNAIGVVEQARHHRIQLRRRDFLIQQESCGIRERGAKAFNGLIAFSFVHEHSRCTAASCRERNWRLLLQFRSLIVRGQPHVYGLREALIRHGSECQEKRTDGKDRNFLEFQHELPPEFLTMAKG